ncbi:MAG: hypothetical protein ACI4U3_02635 [Traorella sp.]
MDLLVILTIIIALFVAGMIAMMLGVLLFVGIAWLILILIQIALAMLIKAITGRSPSWLLSKTAFKIEAVIAIVVIFAFYLKPVDSATLIPDNCSTISYSTDMDDGGKATVYRQEQVEDIIDLLGNYELNRRLNFEFINETVIMHDYGGMFLHLRDENGELLKKVRLYGDMFGFADKEDEKFTYYKAKGKINIDPYKHVIYQQGWNNTLDLFRDKLDALRNSWSYHNGTFTAILPNWETDDWKVMVDGRIPVFDEDGDKAETNYITYIEWKANEGNHYPGEIIQFTLSDEKYEKLTCTVRIGNYNYETSLLSMIEEDKIWP